MTAVDLPNVQECGPPPVAPSEVVDLPRSFQRQRERAGNVDNGGGGGRDERPVELSVVVPVYNEEPCLAELHRRLSAVMQGVGRSYEIIFVDDGSSDGSLALLRAFSRQDPHARYISFTRNFSQAAAITAGQMAAGGVAIIGVDADLQNPPEEIPKLLAKFDQGYEVVYGIRQGRQDPWLRRAASWLVTRLLEASMGISVQPNVTAFLIMHRRFVEEMNRCPEQTRFHPALCAWLGARTAHVEVAHAARHAGQSKYTYWGLFKRALDLFTGFTHAPLRVATWAGVMFSLLGFSMAGWAIIQRLVDGTTLLGWASVLGTIGLLGGVQLLTIGALGEYVGRSYTQLLSRPLYVVRETDGSRSDLEALRFPSRDRQVASERVGG